MIKMLTQENCAQCTALKNYLDLGLRGKYDEHIEIVKREDNPDEFNKLVELYSIMGTPALIGRDGNVLRNCTIGEVKGFLDSNI